MRKLYLSIMLLALSSLMYSSASALDEPSSLPKKVKKMKEKEAQTSLPPSDEERSDLGWMEEYVDAPIPDDEELYTGAESQILAPMEKRSELEKLRTMNAQNNIQDEMQKYKDSNIRQKMEAPIDEPIPDDGELYTGAESQTLAPMEKRNELEKLRTMNAQSNISEEIKQYKKTNVQQKRDFWENWAKQNAK